MNQSKINAFALYLEEKGYAKSTIHCYSVALTQADGDWEHIEPQVLYENINNVLKMKSDFAPSVKNNIGPALKAIW